LQNLDQNIGRVFKKHANGFYCHRFLWFVLPRFQSSATDFYGLYCLVFKYYAFKYKLRLSLVLRSPQMISLMKRRGYQMTENLNQNMKNISLRVVRNVG
jgi:hypothetical protein